MTAQDLYCGGTVFDPSIASLILAPGAENFTLSSASSDTMLLDAIGRQCWIDPDELSRQRILENMRWTKLERLMSDFANALFGHAATTTVSSFPYEGIDSATPQVPAREFPFCRHFDLTASPVEGLNFDLDDYVPR